MNVIQLSGESDQSAGQLFEQAIAKIMQGLGAVPNKLLEQDVSAKRLQFSGSTFMHRYDVWVKIVWSFQIHPRSVTVRICQSHYNDQLNTSFRQIVISSFQQFCYFTHLANKNRLNCQQGSFYIEDATSTFAYRIIEQRFCFFSCPHRLRRYLQHKIRSIDTLFSEQMSRFVEFYKVPGFNAGPTGRESEHSIKLNKLQIKINILKQIYEIQRLTRPRRSNINLKLAHNKIVTAIITNLTGQKQLIRRIPSFQKHQKQSTETQFDKFKQELPLMHSERADVLLTPIRIQKIFDENVIMRGGFGQISLGTYKIIRQLTLMFSSIDVQTVRAKEDRSSFGSSGKGIATQNKVTRLIKKTKITQEVCPSMENQIAFLIKMRNTRCKHVASYYGEIKYKQKQAPFQDKNLFVQYYPNHLAHFFQTKPKLRLKIQIMAEISSGLNFLANNQIIHRDLKPQNIMISENGHCKIIDFGSCCPIYGSLSLQVYDSKLRSTEGYYYPYQKLAKISKALSEKFSKDEFESHRSFDLYSFGEIIERLFELGSNGQENEFVTSNIKYLSLKCKQLNPEDRLRHQDVIFFLKSLIQYLDCRKQFWERPASALLLEDSPSQQDPYNEANQLFPDLDRFNIKSNSENSENIQFSEQLKF